MIGIIGALEIEIEGINALLADKKEYRLFGITFVSGKLAGKQCVTCICEVGKVNAAMSTTLMIKEFSPSLIINTGVAGALQKGIDIGDIVIGIDVVQHDFDITASGNHPLGAVEVGDELVVRFPSDAAATRILQDVAERLSEDSQVFPGTIATGDQFINGKESRHMIANEFGAFACEMEGGAIAQVCYRAKVPHVLLRSISDNIEKDDFVDFKVFSKRAAEKNNAIIIGFLEAM